MKKMMMIALLTLVTANAFAADEEKVEAVCDQAQTMPDNNIHIEVVSGGITGLTRLEVTESLFVGVRKSKLYVSQRQMTPDQSNWVIYNSKNVALAIDTSKVDPSTKKFVSSFIVKSKGSKQSRAMLCELK